MLCSLLSFIDGGPRNKASDIAQWRWDVLWQQIPDLFIKNYASWVASAAAIYMTVSNKSVKHPWLLRAWWFCSFIMSIFGVVQDTHLRIISHGNLSVQDYIEFFSFIPSTFLFGYSFRGKTGMVSNDRTNGATDPLLYETDAKHFQYTRESLYGQSTLLQWSRSQGLTHCSILESRNRLIWTKFQTLCQRQCRILF